MANQKKEKIDIGIDDVVCWGERQEIGIVKEIRIIDTAKFVQKFSGDEDAVMLRIRTDLGTALICPEEHGVSKVSDHDAKEFKTKFNKLSKKEGLDQ